MNSNKPRLRPKLFTKGEWYLAVSPMKGAPQAALVDPEQSLFHGRKPIVWTGVSQGSKKSSAETIAHPRAANLEQSQFRDMKRCALTNATRGGKKRNARLPKQANQEQFLFRNWNEMFWTTHCKKGNKPLQRNEPNGIDRTKREPNTTDLAKHQQAGSCCCDSRSRSR